MFKKPPLSAARTSPHSAAVFAFTAPCRTSCAASVSLLSLRACASAAKEMRAVSPRVKLRDARYSPCVRPRESLKALALSHWKSLSEE